MRFIAEEIKSNKMKEKKAENMEKKKKEEIY